MIRKIAKTVKISQKSVHVHLKKHEMRTVGSKIIRAFEIILVKNLIPNVVL